MRLEAVDEYINYSMEKLYTDRKHTINNELFTVCLTELAGPNRVSVNALQLDFVRIGLE